MRQEFEDGLRGYIALGSGLSPRNVIPGNSDGPRPRTAYGSVLLINDITLNKPIIVGKTDGDEIRLDHRVSRRATFSVQFYRDGAHDLAVSLSMWAFSDVGALAAEGLSIKLHEASEIRQIDDVISGNYEERSSIDLVVDYWDDRSYKVDPIETADLNMTAI